MRVSFYNDRDARCSYQRTSDLMWSMDWKNDECISDTYEKSFFQFYSVDQWPFHF